MSSILYIIGALLIFGLIVISHELGHFLVGRACGIGVEEFSMGFGPKLLGFTGKTTQYSLRAIPLGGYCRFVGEDEENDRPDAMKNQNVWKRIFTVFAGPFMNFVLAYLAIIVFLMAVGFQFTAPYVAEVAPGMNAQAAGMMVGDVVTSLNGEEIPFSAEGASALRAAVQASDPAMPIQFTVRRGEETLTIPVAATKTDEGYMIGISMGAAAYRFTLWEALPEGIAMMKNIMVTMLDALKNLFFKGEGVEDTMGPVGVISFMSKEISQGFDMVLNLIVVISLNLGIMNLLPFPALDGGRLVFLLVEAVRGKPVKPEHEGWVHAAGFIALMGLVVVITYRDILRLITGG